MGLIHGPYNPVMLDFLRLTNLLLLPIPLFHLLLPLFPKRLSTTHLMIPTHLLPALPRLRLRNIPLRNLPRPHHDLLPASPLPRTLPDGSLPLLPVLLPQKGTIMPRNMKCYSQSGHHMLQTHHQHSLLRTLPFRLPQPLKAPRHLALHPLPLSGSRGSDHEDPTTPFHLLI
jgi:hypothetical protein